MLDAPLKNILLKLPADLHTALKIAAARQGVTLSSLMHEALRPLYERAQAADAQIPKEGA